MFRSSVKFIVALAALFALASCSEPNLPIYIDLGDLRVIGLQANTPEASPGATVTLTPIVSDFFGAGRTLTFNVQACIDPGVSLGATPTCAVSDTVTPSTGTFVPTAGASTTYTSPVTTFTITTPPATTIFAQQSAQNQYNGVSYLVVYTVSAASGSSVTAFKRILVSTRPTPNQNPAIASINLNDVAITGTPATPTQATNFSAIASSPTINYQSMNSDGSFSTQTSTLISTWFITDGSFQFDRTTGSGENSFTPPAAKPTTHNLMFFVITRDGRGGEAFQQIQFN